MNIDVDVLTVMTPGDLFKPVLMTYCGLQYGETPLHMAAKNGCNDAACLLLGHGAFIEAKANVLFFAL